MKKSFIQGFVAGALVFGGAISFAANYEALTATFPILINGQKFESDKPIVVIEGSTYLPLKAIGEALNVKVKWNGELNQVEIGEDLTSATDKLQQQQETLSVNIGQQNALKSAKSYLEFQSFSREGLIKQLEYEKYSKEDATYAVDNCSADWNEQASKSAKSYLELQSFSREGLIEQLEYEGFTHEQAIYGVTSVGY